MHTCLDECGWERREPLPTTALTDVLEFDIAVAGRLGVVEGGGSGLRVGLFTAISQRQ